MAQNQLLQKDVITQQVNNLLMTYPDLEQDEQLRHDMLEGSTSAFEYIETQLKAAAEKKALLKSLKEYVDTLKERADRIDHEIEVHRQMIRKVMDQAQLKSMKLPVATVTLASGRPKVIIKDLELLPDDCKRVIVEPNKIAIAAKFGAGEQVPGAELSNAEPFLQVKFK